MDRAEATGLGVAIAGHAGLIVLLALGLAATREITPPPTMEVSFVEDVGPVTSAPETAEPPAPSLGEEIGAPEEASGAEASVPEPVLAPVPEPVRPPVETADRRRPDVTRNAVPVQPRARPRPQPQVQPPPNRSAQAQPVRRPPAPQPRAAAPGRGQGQRSTGFDPRRLAQVIGRGPPEARGTAPAAPARLSGAQQQALARQIGNLIQPCSARANPPNGFARSISVVLRVSVAANGSPQSHQLVSSAGTNDSNEEYVGAVVDTAMRAVRACASRIASLPAEQYSVPGGWRTFTYRFRFP